MTSGATESHSLSDTSLSCTILSVFAKTTQIRSTLVKKENEEEEEDKENADWTILEC